MKKKIIGSIAVSAQEMCIVHTTDGDVEVPVGTAILLDDALRFADDGGFQDRRSDVGDGIAISYGNHTVTIVAFPDGNGGWITPGATPEPKWVALTREQVALLPDRVPVRVEREGVVSEGLFCAARHLPESVCLHLTGGYWWTGNMPNVTVWVHPEDVPVDPDADLVERAARTLSEMVALKWDTLSEDSRELYRDRARTVIAMAREEKA